MAQQINIYAVRITPKQKKDLLGIYQDYLYFTQGLELVLKNNSADGLAYMFVQRVGWDKTLADNLPWNLTWADDTEKEAYRHFASGQVPENEKYTYMSLYHTKTEDDVNLPKISSYPETYDFTNIDLDLPCVVERYAAACPKNQTMKDASFLIDGIFKAKYMGDKFKDDSIYDGLNNYKVQDELRVLLNLVDFYNRNKYRIEYDQADPMKYMTTLMKKIMATEAVSGFENKVLELLGLYADKTQDILHGFFPTRDPSKIFDVAAQEKLIGSAETMQQYMNIRQLMRHQWDMLDKTGRFALGGNQKNEKLRKEYLQTYHQIFDKTMVERIKTYQKIARDMQVFLAVLYPELLVREVGESNSKFAQRLKEWQVKNPDIHPMVCVNYPVTSDKKAALVRNLGKIVPQAKILDNMQESDLENFAEVEKSYFHRAWFLNLYDHIESDMNDYCFLRGNLFKRDDLWNYFQKKILSSQEADTWCIYRQLRNDLSHNHLSPALRETLEKVVNGSFGADCGKFNEKLSLNDLRVVRQENGTYLVTQKDGSVIHIDLSKRQILGRTDKNGHHFENKIKPQMAVSDSPVKVLWRAGAIVDCKLENGIDIDVARKKIIFPDDTHLYLEAEKYNVFRFANGNKLLTDKNFMVTSFIERGRRVDVDRNESIIVAPKHRVKINHQKYLSEDAIFLSDEQKLKTQFISDKKGSGIYFSDGTILRIFAGNFEVSHNGIVLDYKNRHAFIQSYVTQSVALQKNGVER
ncbi:MAG: hypothetical protein IJ545_02820 [Alphaproteobacteria bacterium]|nr:hypothetical protein [Alphaproteobacteria bacterium]